MRMGKTIKPGTRVTRALVCERAVNEEARTVSLSFSSEAPYRRWWGIEILDHTPSSVRLDRLKSGGPLLIDHQNSIRNQVGIIESVEICADRVGRAVVRFGSDAESDAVFQKVKDGIVRNVSVGYIIHRAELVGDDDGVEIYRVTDWEPLEISLVAVPADTSVGIDRSFDGGEDVIQIIEKEKQVENTTVNQPEVNIEAIRVEAVNSERKRVEEIMALGEMHAKRGGDRIAAEALRNGWSVDEFKRKLLEHLANQPLPTAEIGMTDKEARQFSFLRAINALANPLDRKAQEAAAFEREVSDAVAQKMGRPAGGFFVPVEVQQRDLAVGTPSAGGYLVATDLLATNFIDMLRNRLVVMSAGAQMLTGLVGNIAIPRQTGGATAYWVAEGVAPTESQPTFDQVVMSPKTVAAFTDINSQLLLQSSISVEMMVRDELAKTIAAAIDLAAINGSGSGAEPRGVLNTTGIGDVAGGTNGAAPTWAHIVALETLISVANADVGSMVYVTNAKVRGKLKTTTKVATSGDTMVWENNDAPVNGYRALVSNQVPSNLTKGTSVGVCSAIIFGNWSDLIIGQWGALDLMVDPYTQATSRVVRVIAHQNVDIAVRHPQSFAAMKDALTN
jgi:HK97 family phage major capsid protein/HK97 family phage prohead protease